jgi:hypothetical protein
MRTTPDICLVISALCPEIERRLQNAGWNGSIGKDSDRIKPTTYETTRVSSDHVVHHVVANLDDLRLNFTWDEHLLSTGSVSSEISSFSFTKA